MYLTCGNVYLRMWLRFSKLPQTHVDACVHMVERPEVFDVIVTTNMFGDIITDLAAVTQGGMGVAASGNINPNGVSCLSQLVGQRQILQVRMKLIQWQPLVPHLMLDHLGYSEAASQLEQAKIKVIQQMKSMLAGKMGFKPQKLRI